MRGFKNGHQIPAWGNEKQMITAIVQKDIKWVREANPINLPDPSEDISRAFFYLKCNEWEKVEVSLKTWEIDEESLYRVSDDIYLKELTPGQEVTGYEKNGKFWVV